MSGSSPSGAFAGDLAPRWLILFAVGAIAGLIIAGIGLFTARGTRLSTIPAADAAIVNGVPILRSDLIDQIRALDDAAIGDTTPARQRAILDDMIREELYVQRGIELGFAEDDLDVRSALVAGLRARIAAREFRTTAAAPDLQAWFRQHAAAYRTEGIMDVTDRAAGPEPGPQYYDLARARLGPALFRRARGMASNTVSPPISALDGPHVLAMAHNQPPAPLPYRDVRQAVLDDFHRAAVARQVVAQKQALRREATIVRAADAP